MKKLIDKLYCGIMLSSDELTEIIKNSDPDIKSYLFNKADDKRKQIYGNKVFIRGLIEISNICRNNCYYCGIRAENKNIERYRLTEEQIIECCKIGYKIGFRTFVLQGGEDEFYNDDRLCCIIEKIKSLYPDCALTLSLGERSEESYRRLKDSGADRYLLRHETADEKHYSMLHPENMSSLNRKKCLEALKQVGFQTGAGFMVGSPHQTYENLAEDLKFLYALKPEMVGIGPFIPHKDTPFKNETPGTLELTLCMIALTRLILPHALIPSTTALGSVAPDGRLLGIKAGANVVMPNLSPQNYRSLYTLYNNKASFGAESSEGLAILKLDMKKSGYEVVTERGDYIGKAD